MHSLLPRPIGRSRIEIGGPDVRLLGRDAELDLLVGAAQRGLDDAVLIHVEAEAGLGKSRLLQEVTRRLDGVRVGEATCSELEQHLPYVPIAAALRQAIDGLSIDVRRTPAVGQILPELAPSDSAGQKFEEVEVLEALVAVVADHAPLVLVLDDLQWADPSTLAAIAYMRRRGDGLRVAIVTAAVPRDPLSEAHLRGLAPDTILRLEPLTEAELAPLGMPDLHEATGGHPRAVADVMANGRPASPSRSLTEALLAQCRAEGPRAFRLLTAASVLDQPFDPEPLADLLDTDPTELTEELERLCERRILRIDGLHFRFRYDLVRQALRETISPARERLLHRRLDRPAGRRRLQNGVAGPMTSMEATNDLISGTCFEHSHEPAYVMDPEHSCVLAANDAGCALLGYTREELLRTPISSIHPSELAELTELLERVVRDGRASTIKLTCRTKQGTFLPTEISLHALEIGGRLRILGLVQDRSEHRQRCSLDD